MALVPPGSKSHLFLFATAVVASQPGRVSRRSHVLVLQSADLRQGTNTTFENKYGVYISDSQVLAANTSIAATIKGRCPLGRPWNAQHRSIFIESYFDESVRPDGYIQWGATDPRITNLTFMAVYNDFGPGWNPDALKANNLTRFLDDSQVEPYRRPVDVFIDEDGTPGDIAWIDHSVLID